jgi:integrase/recombinase XerD
MGQAKVLNEVEFKRALAVVTGRRYAARDRLALLLTHWAGMRVCEAAGLTWAQVLGPTGQVLEEWRLESDGTKGSRGRVVYANSRLRKELAAYLKTIAPPLPADPVLRSQKSRARGGGFSANTLCQLIISIYREAGIAGASSHSGRRGFITSLANKAVGVKVIMELAGHRQLSTTQRYIEVTPDQKRNAVELLA